MTENVDKCGSKVQNRGQSLQHRTESDTPTTTLSSFGPEACLLYQGRPHAMAP